jgi:signal transduction histidine kinase
LAETLSARVTRATALAAGVASLVAAAVTVFVADRLVVEQEERRLRQVATISAREFLHAPVLQTQIEDEIEELRPESIRIAVYQDEKLVGGDGHVANIAADTCMSQSSTRTCSAAMGPFRVVVAAATTPRSIEAGLLASAIAMLVAVAAAAIIGGRATRWALRPLDELRDSLSTIGDDPRAATMSGDDTVGEIAALRSAIADLLARLGAALDAARRFSADAAHELKTPLTAIRAELDLLAEEPLDAHTAEAVERLRGRVVALTRLIERLLALAKASARSRLEVEAVALEDVVRRMAGPRVRVAVDAPGMVNGDELLLAALVENAVENALKFSKDKPIDVRVSEREGSVILDVIDDGPGLAPEDREHAFEPFFRAASSRATTPGHGVGLAIVAQVAEAHGGKAEFVDGDERGAHLRVELPAWSAPAR